MIPIANKPVSQYVLEDLVSCGIRDIAICDVFGFNRELVEPISIKSLSFKAPRPMNSSFRNERAIRMLGIDLNNIKGALKILKKELGYR